MKTNVKPGDLAIVVKSRNTANIGKIVMVVRQAYEGDRNQLPDGRWSVFVPYNPKEAPFWYCETRGEPLQTTQGGRRGVPCPWANYRDSCLRPLRDDSEDDVSRTTNQLKETA